MILFYYKRYTIKYRQFWNNNDTCCYWSSKNIDNLLYLSIFRCTSWRKMITHPIHSLSRAEYRELLAVWDSTMINWRISWYDSKIWQCNAFWFHWRDFLHCTLREYGSPDKIYRFTIVRWKAIYCWHVSTLNT